MGLARSLSLVAVAVGLFVGVSNAEIYQGICPYMHAIDVKGLFPNATFEWMEPSWAQEADALCKITGPGLVGKIIVKFDDERPRYRRLSLGVASTILDSFYVKTISRERLERMASMPDDSALTVSWVRWVPDQPVPLKRLVAKYGTAFVDGVSDTDFRAYRSWPKRDVTAFLTDDSKSVTQVEFGFTDDEEWGELYRRNPNLTPTMKRFREQSKGSKR